jgi:membrane associated rhomboid family serine protease
MIPLRDDQPTFSTPCVNYFLIVLNVVVFLWERAQSPRALSAFVREFGLVPSHTVAVLTGHSHDALAAGIVPLFTSLFLHASLLHVAGNMLFLWIFGDNVEDYLGHFSYLVFYLASGLAASFTHILLNLNSHAPTVGASGAIAGCIFHGLSPGARAHLVLCLHILAAGLAGSRLLVLASVFRVSSVRSGRSRGLGALGRIRCRGDHD